MVAVVFGILIIITDQWCRSIIHKVIISIQIIALNPLKPDSFKRNLIIIINIIINGRK